MNKLLNSLIIILVCFGKTLFADTVCGDWQTFNGEKCYQVIGSVQSYDEAITACNKYDSSLVTIASLAEQQFIENYLFATLKTVENVWTGLRYTNTSAYKWINDLNANYTNWSEHSPKNNSELCVQLSSDDLSLGKWSDISCVKKNLALCEKLPTITTQLLMNMVITLRNSFENSISQLSTKLENTSKQLLLTNSKLESTEQRLKNCNKQLDYFFSNKWIHFKAFSENNTRKALIYPYKTQPKVSRSNAIELCRQNNATLVDIESVEKQKIVETFLYQLNPKLEFVYYFIGGYFESSTSKHKWLNSGNEFSYTNWVQNNNRIDFSNVIIGMNSGDTNDGKWYTEEDSYQWNVFCEITLNI